MLSAFFGVATKYSELSALAVWQGSFQRFVLRLREAPAGVIPCNRSRAQWLLCNICTYELTSQFDEI